MNDCICRGYDGSGIDQHGGHSCPVHAQEAVIIMAVSTDTEGRQIFDMSNGGRVVLPDGEGVQTDEYGISTVDLTNLPPTPTTKEEKESV